MNTFPETRRGWPIAGIVILVGLGAINVFLPLFIVPKFEQIFQDALPGKPLPAITDFIIAARVPLALIAIAWPLAGMLMILRRVRAAIWVVHLGCLYFFVLIGVTVLALFMPMTSFGTTGMSEEPITSSAASQ